MARLLYICSCFLSGCIASSFLAWLGSLHPALLQVMWLIYGLLTMGLALALLLDDAIRPYLRLTEQTYYALLIAIASATILGGVIEWLVP